MDNGNFPKQNVFLAPIYLDVNVKSFTSFQIFRVESNYPICKWFQYKKVLFSASFTLSSSLSYSFFMSIHQNEGIAIVNIRKQQISNHRRIPSKSECEHLIGGQ